MPTAYRGPGYASPGLYVSLSAALRTCYDSGNIMDLRYADNELERQCTDGRYMQRKLGAQRARALKLRLDELRRVTELGDLLFIAGKWEELRGDRGGQWSGRLTANWRLIIEPDQTTVTIVLIREIVDYH